MRRLVLFSLLLAACATTPLEKRSWLEVRSPNFTILTNLSQAKAVALSEELETFRAVLGKLTTAKSTELRVPTRIFAFAGAHEFQNFAPDYSTRGYFRAGLRENIVAIDASDSRGIDARTIMFHEYTHFLLHNHADVPLPLWFDEGFAEFLGTTRIDAKSVFIGSAPTFRRADALWGDPHSVESIVRARNFEAWDDAQTSMFYLQSWQLVHYLMLGRDKGMSAGGKVVQYARLLEQGQDAEAAFEAALGMDFDDLFRELRRYNQIPKIPALDLPRSLFPVGKVTEVRSLPAAEMAVPLGFLALSVGRFDLAEGYFNRAISLDPNCARAYAGLAIVEQNVRNGELSRADFERALELAPDDYETHLEFAEWIHQTAEQEQRPSQLAEAREHYQRAIELAPKVPEGYAMLGRTYVMTDEDPGPGIQALEHARALLPGQVELLLPLAQLYERAGRDAEARNAAQRVARWSHGTLYEDAEKLLAELEAPANPKPESAPATQAP